MNRNEHIEVEDLAMYALLLLSEEDASVIREHLEGCAEGREELKQVREDLATYALAVEPVAVPEGASERFLTSLNGEQETSSSITVRAPLSTYAAGPVPVEPVPLGKKQRRTSAVRVLSWTGWAAAAAAVVVAVGLKQDRDALRSALATQSQQTARLQANEERARHILSTLTDPAAVRVNLTVPKAATTPTAKATYEQTSGTLLLLASNLAPLQAQKVYELWIIPADGSKPVAAGTFRPDAHGNGSLLVPSLRGAVAAKAFGITVEPIGGSPTPTLPILLAGSPA